MKKQIFTKRVKIVGIIILFVFLGIVIFIYKNPLFYIKFPPHISKRISNMDYIKIKGTGEVIYITKVKTMESGLMKDPVEATLYYKDGSLVDIMLYGNSFGIVGEDYGLFGKDFLYLFNYDNE